MRLAGILGTVGCPPLPLRCSDRKEYAGIMGDFSPEEDMINMNLQITTRLYWDTLGYISLEYDPRMGSESPFFPRGIYRVEDHYLRITDWCGFFELRLAGEGDGILTVYPSARRMETGMADRRDRSTEKPVFISWRKDRDLSDPRPYVEGDDPRRINWKMLARHEELFIREGNSLSPSRRSALLILDGSGSHDETDSLFRSLCFLSRELSDKGLLLTAALPGKDPVGGLESMTDREREDLFASVPPLPLDRSRLPQGDDFAMVFLFSGMHTDEALFDSVERSCRGGGKYWILSPGEGPVMNKKRLGWNIVFT